jgi:acyl carrier protein
MTLPHATSERIVDCLRRLAQNGELPARLSTVAVDEETSLGQLGVDSFGRVLLLQAVESEFDVLLSDGLLWGVETLGELARAVERQTSGG